MIYQIPLTMGKVTIVDQDVYEEFVKFKWYAEKQPNSFYAARTPIVNGKKLHVKLHRVIMNAPPNQRVDHIDLNGLNNVRSNLRLVTISQNAMNGRGHQDGSSRHRGVYWFADRGKWVAKICKEGRRKSLGYYINEDDAGRAYDAAAIELFGEFANLNFPENK